MWCVLDNAGNILAGLARLKSCLTNILEPDFGLQDELVGLKVLTRHDVADVRCEGTVQRRCEAVLDLLVSEQQCRRFMTALQRTDQQHVVNFITQNAGPKHWFTAK